MTLDEQIKQFEDFVTKIENVKKLNTDEYFMTANQQSIDDHENLISWLKELQLYRKGVAETFHKITELENSTYEMLENFQPTRANGKSTGQLVTHIVISGMNKAFTRCLSIMHEELDITEEDIK